MVDTIDTSEPYLKESLQKLQETLKSATPGYLSNSRPQSFWSLSPGFPFFSVCFSVRSTKPVSPLFVTLTRPKKTASPWMLIELPSCTSEAQQLSASDSPGGATRLFQLERLGRFHSSLICFHLVFTRSIMSSHPLSQEVFL